MHILLQNTKLDISSSGSGNPGTSNVMRTIIKGMLHRIDYDVLYALPIYLFDENLLLCGLAAAVGHIYPIFYKFKGGKGVATYVGMYIVFSTLNPYSYGLFENFYLFLNILFMLFYFVIFKIFRISAIAS